MGSPGIRIFKGISLLVFLPIFLCVFPAGLAGQVRLVEPRAATFSPSYRQWSFSTPVETDKLLVSKVGQLSIPLAVSFSPFRNWRVDISGAYSLGSVKTRDPISNTEWSLSLDGPTDAKVRAVGRLVGERLWVTLGANLPTGHVNLSEDEAAAIRVIGAPALRMRTPVLGSGAGYTAGTVYTGTLGPWAVGLGLSYELRSTYTPLESTFAGTSGVVMDLDPAEAFHASFAVDRISGRGRISILVVGDLYGTDHVKVSSEGGAVETRTHYQLGPSAGLFLDYVMATGSLRDLHLMAAARYRSQFEDGTGVPVGNSEGVSLDLGAEATIGRAGSTGILLGLSTAFDSGADFDNTLATAAMASGTLTLGLDLPLGRHSVRPFLSGTLGSMDTGPSSTRGTSLAGGCTLRTLW